MSHSASGRLGVDLSATATTSDFPLGCREESGDG